MFSSKTILWMSSTRTLGPINQFSLPPQNNSIRGLDFGVPASLYRDSPQRSQWYIYPNISERMTVQPQGEAFSTPKWTSSTTSSILLTLHGMGTWEQCHFKQSCVVCLHDIERKRCTGNRDLTPPLTSCMTLHKAFKTQSPHLWNEGIELNRFLIPFYFLQ